MEAGHEFLTKGKTRLVPRGIEATNWLLNSVEITPETQDWGRVQYWNYYGWAGKNVSHCRNRNWPNADAPKNKRKYREKQHRGEYVTVEQGRRKPLLPR